MEQLIAHVRREPVLYDCRHPDYAKNAVKKVVWEKIGDALGYKNGMAAKNAWLKLRNCHRDALRRKISKSSTGHTPTTWKYEHKMRFLLDYMTNKPGTVGQLSNDLEPECVGEEEEVSVKQEPLDRINVGYETDMAEDLVWCPEEQQVLATLGGGGVLKTMEVGEENRRQRVSPSDDDDLYHFLISTYVSIKKMPLISQHKLRKQIFTAVSDEEEVLLKTKKKKS